MPITLVGMREILGCLFFLMLSGGCHFADRGYRFRAEYQGRELRCRIQLLSQGYVKSGYDLADSSLSLVQFCPLPGAAGRSFRVTMLAVPNEWIRVECADLGMPLTDWKSSEALLADLLTKAGYEGVVSQEVKGFARVMTNFLSGPKGVILEGQIDSIDVLETKIEYGYGGNREKPQKEWIGGSELPGCKS
jgi:hypothetical protein